jgi:hypothetical protein
MAGYAKLLHALGMGEGTMLLHLRTLKEKDVGELVGVGS